MSKKVGVYTADSFLFQKILLDAPSGTEVVRYGEGDIDICLWDLDTGENAPAGAVTMKHGEGADLALPFALGTLERLVGDGVCDKPLLTLSEDKKCAHLDGEKIKLTELEFSLLSAILARGGEYATREELLEKVWGEKAESGILNVYIHYLREKLEKRGEKIILSSRKNGYKIAEKYLGGDGYAENS